MKRLLLLAGLALTLLPHAGEAAESEICNALDGIQPVSEYVKKVLERADKGLERVRKARPNTNFKKYLPSWARQIGEATNELIDSYLTLSSAKDDLLNVTTCQHVDALLLDCKIDEAQTELQAQLEKHAIWGIMQAEALMEFVRERKMHFTRGALNPGYEDPTWDRTWRFESGGSSSSASSARPMCPFDSDYAPPGSDGYGCDASVLGMLTAYPPAQKELEALDALKQEVEKYEQLSGEFAELERELCELHGGEDCAQEGGSQSSSSSHRNEDGCMEDEDGDGENDPLPEDLRLRSVRSPFSYKKNQIAILSDFLGKRLAEGVTREHTDDLKNADEFDVDDGTTEEERQKIQEKKDRVEKEARNPLIQLFKNSARDYFESVSGNQGRQESVLFASTPDSTLEAADALKDLRKSIGGLSKLSGPQDGLRSFIIGYGYFLRRTCVFSACNTSLERVLRTAYADECFPYTDGEFLGDSEGDPRWKKCAEAACIAVDGVQLPESCEEVLP